MDECPRCQGLLQELSLGEVSTITCSQCRYADVPVEHERIGQNVESWRDALERFYQSSEESEKR
jgi:hypothetical protein